MTTEDRRRQHAIDNVRERLDVARALEDIRVLDARRLAEEIVDAVLALTRPTQEPTK